MREYETVFVLHPSIEEKDVEAEIQAISDLITGTGGAVEEVERWGRRRLAYEIQKVHEGTYTLIRFHGEAQTLKDLDRRFRLNEKLLRHLTILSEGPPPPPPQPESERRDHRDQDDGEFELPRRHGPGRSHEHRPAPPPREAEGAERTPDQA